MYVIKRKIVTDMGEERIIATLIHCWGHCKVCNCCGRSEGYHRAHNLATPLSVPKRSGSLYSYRPFMQVFRATLLIMSKMSRHQSVNHQCQICPGWQVKITKFPNTLQHQWILLSVDCGRYQSAYHLLMYVCPETKVDLVVV